MRILIVGFCLILWSGMFSCTSVTTKDITDLLESGLSSKKGLTESDVVSGLKEALQIGTQRTVNLSSITNGFWNNSLIKIPLPDKFTTIQEKLIQIGLSKQVEEFHHVLNTAAEKASAKAGPIFISAIKGMSIQDAFSILKGGENSATTYFKNNTYTQLYSTFLPEIKQTMSQTGVTKIYSDLVTQYNRIPLVQKFNYSLEDYVCEKTLSGVFTLLGNEEKKIRQDPGARTTDLLKRVFSNN